MKKMSPMMQQYLNKKEEYKDCILLYRLGDFYEMFFEDALEVSKALGITLTARDCGDNKKAPMCGIPYHACNNYINKLIALGFKVAMCEQLTNPTKGELVTRDVVRVITPGTIMETELLDDTKNNFIACIFCDNFGFGISYVDITTGDLFTVQGDATNSKEKINDILTRVRPSEVICNMAVKSFYTDLSSYAVGLVPKANDYYDYAFTMDRAQNQICRQFNILSLDKTDIGKLRHCTIATGALLAYLQDTQKRAMANITKINIEKDKNIMQLDINTRRNLELVESMKDRKTKGSLYWVLNKTRTAMGARLLRQWVEQPLQDEFDINNRLDAIEELNNNTIARESINQILREITDIERLCGKIAYGTISPRGCYDLKCTIEKIPEIKQVVSTLNSVLFKNAYKEIVDFEDLVYMLDKAFDKEAPANTRNPGYIKMGFSTILDDYKSKASGGKNDLMQIEVKEKNLTGIKNLKIGYNSVFGYFIEIPKTQIQNVPLDRYQRKQTLTNNERYVTEELKLLEEQILNAEVQMIKVEQELYEQIRQRLIANIPALLQTAKVLAMIDSLMSLSYVALENNFCKPTINSSVKNTEILDGRHCVVEQMLKSDRFVPNDTKLDDLDNRIIVITGPNMAGKSTYMRQVALIVLMAHIGSFVPARSANIALTDRIFTRIGASDDLAFGQSTFMVEMLEVSNILANVTDRSLVVLDEVGRGTSTYDGLSIAWAVVEHLSQNTKAKVLFATHYHELTQLEGNLQGVRNYQISVKEFDNSVIFLRKIIKGGANRSFGIEVASMAGLPNSVIDRAKHILIALNQNEINFKRTELTSDEKEKQKSQMDKLISYISNINIDLLTPIEAFTAIHDLQTIIKEK